MAGVASPAHAGEATCEGVLTRWARFVRTTSPRVFYRGGLSLTSPVELGGKTPGWVVLSFKMSDETARPIHGSRSGFGTLDEIVREGSQSAVAARISEMSERGYRLSGYSYRANKLTFQFMRTPRVLAARDRGTEPDYVEAQRAKLDALYPERPNWGGIHDAQRNFSEAPRVKGILSRANVRKYLSPGSIENPPTREESPEHQYVKICGEKFLRLGFGHHVIGAMECSDASGDIQFFANAEHSGEVDLLINYRSDTYWAPEAALGNAVESLWAQGIYPRRIRLRAVHDEFIADL